MKDQRYADCDGCGERYRGHDIKRWLTPADSPTGELLMLCPDCLRDHEEEEDDASP